MEGKLHVYHEKRQLTLFEYMVPPPTAATSSSSEILATTTSPNVLLFVGGMFDNYGTPGYVSTLAALFPRHQNQQWSVMHIQLTSTGRTFGIVDINRDIDEIAAGIRFIREQLRSNQSTNIVLMGHSTGCQDTLYYLHSTKSPPPSNRSTSSVPPSSITAQPDLRPPVQGAILQAPVSDRDALEDAINKKPDIRAKYDKCMTMIEQTPDTEYRTTILPMHWTSPVFGPVPMSIHRFLHLSSPSSPNQPSIEDLLSFDLPLEILESTFGHIGKNGVLIPASSHSNTKSASTNSNHPRKAMLVLISDEDEFYTPDISPRKAEFLDKWRQALSPAGDIPDHRVDLHVESKCIEHANHAVSGDGHAQRKARLVDLRGSVLRYIDDVVGGVDGVAWDIFRRDEESLKLGGGLVVGKAEGAVSGMKL